MCIRDRDIINKFPEKYSDEYRLSNGTVVLSNKKMFEVNGLKVIIDGFVIPRNQVFNEYRSVSQYDMVLSLFMKHGVNFGRYLKGFFCILIAEAERITIINDIHSVKRCYISKIKQDYLISNDITALKPFSGFKIDPMAPAVQALLQHFAGGLTMFEDIGYSAPASVIKISHDRIESDKYYESSDFIKLNRGMVSENDFHEVFRNSINNYIEYIKPCLLYTSPSPRDRTRSRMPSSA